MEYKLGLLQTIEVMFRADNIVEIILLLFVQLLLPIILYISLRRHRKIRAVVLALLIAQMVGFSIAPIYGSGWQITDKTLHFKSYFSSADIPINETEIGFVANNGEWQPFIREMGAGLPYLLAGKCTLVNKKSAVVFDYYNQDKLLLITTKHRYYLIGHPSVEKLRDELIKLGAKEKKFEQ